MNRRLLGSIGLAAALAFLLLTATMLFASGETQAGQAATSGVSAQSTQKDKLDQTAGTWADIAPFPNVVVSPTPGSNPLRLKRAGGAAYPWNGKLYVLGGRHGVDGQDVAMQNIWEHTPGNPGSWTQKAALLDGGELGNRYTANMAVAVLTDTNGPRIYAIGGTNVDSIPINRVRVYNPILDTVTELTSDPWPASPARIAGGWAVHDNKLYIFGGFSRIANTHFAETWEFDPLRPAGSRWAQKASLNTGRAYIAGATLDGKIYAIGGDTWNGTTLIPVANVERYDPVANTWTPVASLPTARGDMGAWAYDSNTNYEISGRVAIAGGVYPTPDAVGYLYNPVANSWSGFPSMVHATRNYAYAQMDGYLYAFGGYDFTTGAPSGANWNQRYDATGPVQTVTPTGTGTPPTSTPTNTAPPTSTATNTTQPSATPDPCLTGNYTYTTATATIVPGTTDTGNHCDDCVTTITLPFSFRLYDQNFTSVNLDSNGRAMFVDSSSEYTPTCFPIVGMTYLIVPYWDDLMTSTTLTCSPGPCGIFTSVSGTAPNRIFNIEWRAQFYPGTGNANFELRLYENPAGRFDLVFGPITNTSGGTVGVQKNQTTYTQYRCGVQGGDVSNGRLVMFSPPSCPTGTVTVITTPTSTSTSLPTTAVPTTAVPTTAVPTTAVPTTAVPTTAMATTAVPTTAVPTTAVPTETPCAASFSDVPTSNPFYPNIMCLACRGIIGGYADGTFKPGNPTTRGQMSKIVANAANIQDPVPPTQQTYTDVPRSHTFWVYIERLSGRGIVGGYDDPVNCAGVGIPCFRPERNVTRGQMTRFASNAAGFSDNPPAGTQTFTDVPPDHPFYVFVERLVSRGVISGYQCGQPPAGACDPQNRPWFLPGGDVTRGQTSKIVANTFFPGCGTTTEVVIQYFTNTPEDVTILAGSTVRWSNLEEAIPHTATSTNPPGVFDSGSIAPGHSYEFTFNTTGVYEYVCSLHVIHGGTITVIRP